MFQLGEKFVKRFTYKRKLVEKIEISAQELTSAAKVTFRDQITKIDYEEFIIQAAHLSDRTACSAHCLQQCPYVQFRR